MSRLVSEYAETYIDSHMFSLFVRIGAYYLKFYVMNDKDFEESCDEYNSNEIPLEDFLIKYLNHDLVKFTHNLEISKIRFIKGWFSYDESTKVFTDVAELRNAIRNAVKKLFHEEEEKVGISNDNEVKFKTDPNYKPFYTYL